MRGQIKRVVVDPAFENASLPIEISQKLNIEIEYMTKDALTKSIQKLPDNELFIEAKTILFFTENRGSMFRKCPGSKGVLCCNYYTINSVSGCPFDCSYCILQHYIYNNPFITVFLNREKSIEEMGEMLKNHSHVRVGTGELADSLAFDDFLDESGFFLKAISEKGWQDKVTFEFKTKSAEVDLLIENMKKYPEVDAVAGFSVNIDDFSLREEIDVAKVDERLKAALKVIDAGGTVAIHFDPMIMIDRYYDSYINLAEKIFTMLPGDKIRWISMGGFRHTLSLTATIKKRFPDSILLCGEMFPSDSDNKLRYLASQRRRFYTGIKDKIESIVKDAPLYICMDKSFIWEDIKMTPKKPSLREVFSSK